MPTRRNIGFSPAVAQQGGAAVATKGLGEMPLTLFLIVAAVVLYLYVRRANLGIDKHPGEGKAVPIRPTVRVPYSQGGTPPVMPKVPGTFGPR